MVGPMSDCISIFLFECCGGPIKSLVGVNETLLIPVVRNVERLVVVIHCREHLRSDDAFTMVVVFIF